MINTGVTDRNVTVLAVDPNNPNIVYAGGDNLIFKTTDGGAAGVWRLTV